VFAGNHVGPNGEGDEGGARAGGGMSSVPALGTWVRGSVFVGAACVYACVACVRPAGASELRAHRLGA